MLAKGTTECKKAIFKLQSKRVHFLPATKKQFVSKNSSSPTIFQGKSKTFCKMNCFDLFLFVNEKAIYWDFTGQRERAFEEKLSFIFISEIGYKNLGLKFKSFFKFFSKRGFLLEQNSFMNSNLRFHKLWFVVQKPIILIKFLNHKIRGLLIFHSQ